ncbi:hypothetical protein Flavo103_44820 [Flavobacterium collinsii]|uniref:hypothetical protein n=1 Tax=Flavobacterium collinsii TaxID=1114861 RepID=UPI0022CD1C30|nr:hypothetical protein [Flavobacterium collinsii]GIQ61347.1 hypothetical protein Flavo103_44820 [Flavobacterium collinsii]
MAIYPYSQDAILVNSIIATTIVSYVEGMEVSVTTFTSALGAQASTSPSSSKPANVSGGTLGSVTLSPVQSKAVDIKFIAGSQKIQIDLISFRAQFGLDTGQVICRGKATDLNGENEAIFAKQIAAWS